MGIPQKFNSQLERKGKKIEEFSRSWTEHLQWVERHEAELREQHPPPLIVNTWASPNAIFCAIDRLEAYDEFEKKRFEMLRPQGPDRRHRPIANMIEDIALQERRIGTETDGWRLLKAVFEAQDYLQRRAINHSVQEDQVSHDLGRMRNIQSVLTRQMQSKFIVSVCYNLPELDRRKRILDNIFDEEIDNPDHDAREIWEAADKLATRRKLIHTAVHKFHYNFNRLGSALADLCIDVARRAILEEYFITSDQDALANNASGDEISMVETAEESPSIVRNFTTLE